MCLEEFDILKIEWFNGCDLVQYCGVFMLLVYVNDGDIYKMEGMQLMLVFFDVGCFMGFVVDEIVDIVEDWMNIEVGLECLGILGFVVVKEWVIEIIDLGYYLLQVFEDWFMCKEMDIEVLIKKVFFVDDFVFFWNMLILVLKVVGYDVIICVGLEQVFELLENGDKFYVVVSDIEMLNINGFEFCEFLCCDFRF